MTNSQTTTGDGDPRYRVLLEVVGLIGLHTSLNGLLPDLAGCLGRLVEFDLMGVVLPRSEGEAADLWKVAPAHDDSPVSVEIEPLPPLYNTRLGALWAADTPVVIDDIEIDTRYPEISTALRGGKRSACLVPLATGLRPVGVLGFASARPHAYRGADLALLESVATQVAVAIDNVRHHELATAYQRQLEADRDHWRTLLEVNNAVVTNLDLSELLSDIAPNLQRMVPHDSVTLALLDPDSGRAGLHAMKPPLPRDLEDAVVSIDVANTPFASALALRKPMLSGPIDVAFLPEPFRSHSLLRQFQSICFLPLFTPRRVLGALVLAASSEAAFTTEDLDRMAHVGGQISIAIENALAFREIAALRDRLALENLYLEDEIRGRDQFEEIIGESKALKRVLAQVRSVADTDTTVLLLGETGTGKELVARALHALSPRSPRALVTVNCATSPAGLLESEWFGHERGAFTGALAQKVGRFELAHQGTLFLDEIGDVPLELQAKLLRVLQEHEIERLGSTRPIRVDFRLVAATNRNLEEMVATREYRGDLFYRLNVFPIRIPPLRDRPEDIPPLVRYFTQRYARRLRRPIDSVPRETMAALCRWSWPGNVRELQNVIERAVILSQGPVLKVPLSEFEAPAHAATSQSLADAEREHILRALDATGWVIGGPSGAAVRLGLKRTTLVSTMRRLGIVRPKPGSAR